MESGGSKLKESATSSRTAYRSRRLFYKSHRSLIPSLLLSKPDPLRWAPVWFAALRAALFLDLCVFFVNTCQNKRTSLRMSFCFGFRRPESGFTLGISMLGVGKAAPAQFPACGRKFTRHSARGPEGPFYLFRPPASFSSAQNTSSRTAYRSRRLFYKSHRSLIPSLLLSKPDPLRWAPVWSVALRAAFFNDVKIDVKTRPHFRRRVLSFSPALPGGMLICSAVQPPRRPAPAGWGTPWGRRSPGLPRLQHRQRPPPQLRP